MLLGTVGVEFKKLIGVISLVTADAQLKTAAPSGVPAAGVAGLTNPILALPYLPYRIEDGEQIWRRPQILECHAVFGGTSPITTIDVCMGVSRKNPDDATDSDADTWSENGDNKQTFGPAPAVATANVSQVRRYSTGCAALVHFRTSGETGGGGALDATMKLYVYALLDPAAGLS